MFNFKKLFGKGKQEQPKVNTPVPDTIAETPQAGSEVLPLIAPENSPWNIPLLDLRPITLSMLSSSKDPQMATNAVSYGGEDGTVFWGQQPLYDKTITTNLVIPIDGYLAPGVLFIPDTMEHKWAIFYTGENLIFVRSWTRRVHVIAKTIQENDQLIIKSITGEFMGDEDPAFTKAVLNYLVISHGINEVVPAPLLKELGPNSKEAGLWAFSMFGNMAQVGTFDLNFIPVTNGKLRSHSLLHIAVARGDIDGIEKHISAGIHKNTLAQDGLAPLHWAVAGPFEAMEKLLALGADPNVASLEGATPVMNAVQSNNIDKVNLLLQSGATINHRDDRGFTALHRAAEMGHIDILKVLLAHGADRLIEAEGGHTALSLAQTQNNAAIIELLS
ncbi:ankyrin repeat domain-containing protein [Niastella sp. OAS944]|uniref:ankyrin repeat domain-containing protein n=1 Tax=Niastella sp. OAS944 TaxID=2664089 RepID=UPI003489EDCD|nr:hypothetical protein [Chitinophagaceae bacterium OAS944]